MSFIIVDKQDSDIWQRTTDAWITKLNSEVQLPLIGEPVCVHSIHHKGD
jgi:hypothetical protein